MKFRTLTANDIECRVSQINEKGLSLLLYKNARIDMAVLDEAVGAENWQREHYEVKGNMFCRVGIRCGDAWVWKSDCGVESNTEAQKGEASDSFKRACFNWGIGRELYTAPFIWIPASGCNIERDEKKSRYTCRDHFIVEKIQIDNGTITGLSILNKNKLDENKRYTRVFLLMPPEAKK